MSVLALSFYHTREPLVENQIDSCKAFPFHLFFFLFPFSMMVIPFIYFFAFSKFETLVQKLSFQIGVV